MPTSDNLVGGSFSVAVIQRILNLLTEFGSTKKTNLAGKAGLNYPTCMKYIKFLKLLGWVEVSTDGTNHIYITDLGMRFTHVLSGDSSALMKVDNDNESIPTNNTINKLGSFLVDSLSADLEVKAHGHNDDENHAKQILNIMLVDDEPDVLLTYKLQLVQEGYNVDCFVDSKRAIQSFQSAGYGYYDLVITDIRMNNFNGLQLYYGIKSSSPSTKVIFVSALDAAEEMLSLLPGVTSKDIIRKPVEQAAFLKFVREAINDVMCSGNNNAKSVVTQHRR